MIGHIQTEIKIKLLYKNKIFKIHTLMNNAWNVTHTIVGKDFSLQRPLFFIVLNSKRRCTWAQIFW